MKIVWFLIAIIFFSACKFQKPAKANISNDDWQISHRSIYQNSYRQDGLLDKTFQVRFDYFNGQIVTAVKELVLHIYNKRGQLINEKTFDNETKKISQEISYEYDTANNLVSKTTYTDGMLERSEENKYNQQNQLIKQTIIEQTYEELVNISIDSLKKRKSLPSPTYDTIMSSFHYDFNGKLIQPKGDNNTNENFGIHEDSVNIGDTVIHFSDSPSYIDSSWIVNKLPVKYISLGKKIRGGLMDIFKYNEKGDLIEEIHFRYGQLQAH